MLLCAEQRLDLWKHEWKERGSHPIFPDKDEDGLAWGEDSPAGERVDLGWIVEMRQSPQGVLRES